jgi:hypothetical protein
VISSLIIIIITPSILFQHFQDVEEAHVKQMKDFLSTYAEVLQNNHDLIGQVRFDVVVFK